MFKKSGFTLVELLIVISIIAMLSVVGLVSYTNFLKNSRDAKRQSDIKFIQSALEQYFADQKHYPATITFNSALTNKTGIELSPAGDTKTYLTTVPPGPTSVAEYLYKAYKCDNSDCSTKSACEATDAKKCARYCLYAKGERLSQTISFCPAQTDYTYSVTNP